MPPVIFDWNRMEEMSYLAHYATKRYSDMPDEVQIKDIVSLDNLIALTIPTKYILEKNIVPNIDEIIKEYIKTVKNLLAKYHRDVPVVDLSTKKTLEDDQQIMLILNQNLKELQ